MLKLIRSFLSLGVIVNPFPVTITDGQVVDAVPVMQNFNWLLSQINANVPPLIPSLGALTAFTPVLKFGGANAGMVMASQNGQYYRIGNVVFFWLSIDLTNKGASVGAATVEGLPLTISNATLTGYPCLLHTIAIDAVGPGAGTIPIANLVPNTTTLQLNTITPTVAGFLGALNAGNFQNLSAFRIAGQYFV